MKSIAFVLDNLSANQTVYSLIYNANNYLAKTAQDNITLFYLDDYTPCIQPQFARFRVKDACLFTGTIIATSYKTLLSIKNCARAKRYYYISDLEWKRSWFPKNDIYLNEFWFDKNIGKIVTSSDFLLELPVSATVIEDYNIDKFLELANETNN